MWSTKLWHQSWLYTEIGNTQHRCWVFGCWVLFWVLITPKITPNTETQNNTQHRITPNTEKQNNTQHPITPNTEKKSNNNGVADLCSMTPSDATLYSLR